MSEHTEVRRNRTYQDIQDAVEQVSLGLLILQGQSLETLGPTTLIDVTARLTAQASSLEKLLMPMRSRIIVLAGEYGSNVVRGGSYQAEVLKTVTSVLDVERTEEYLGRVLQRFKKEHQETTISFQIKS